MPSSRIDAARPWRAVPGRFALTLLAWLVLLAACAAPAPSASPSSSPREAPVPTVTSAPTLYFANAPDPALVALIPSEVAGTAVKVPPITDFSITPGDIGEVYGDIGARFRTLQLAYIPQPRLSLFAMRMNAPFATTPGLEPYLAEAGRYVGVAGLHLEAWKLETISGHLVWWRPEDNATLKGTRFYTWAADDLVFLMVGVNEAQNLAMLAALPGGPAATPTPLPSATGRASLPPSSSPSAAAS